MFASHCDARDARGAFTALFAAALILYGSSLAPPAIAATSYPGALISTFSHPSAMAAGDYNLDGAIDFAVLNYATNTVSILLANLDGGSGDGSFTESFQFSVGEEPWDIASGDLDGDGALELVVTEGLANQISIWRPNKPGGSPDGSFWFGGAPGTWEYPVSVEMVDYTGDGRLDIVVANYWSDNVSLFRGDGAGAVSSAGVIDAGTRPIDLGSGDFNGDGETDLAIVNFLSDDASIYLGQTGTNTLAPGGSYEAGPRPVSVAVAPLVDGLDDLAFANYYEDQVTLLISSIAGQAAGNLFDDAREALSPPVLEGGAPRTLELTDLDLDGNYDLIVGLENSDEVVVVKGFGGEIFIGERRFYAGYRPLKLMTAQVDGDGLRDLVLVSHWNHGLIILNGLPAAGGEATLAFEPIQLDAACGSPGQGLLVDLNQDSFLDIVALGQTSGSIAVRRGAAAPAYFGTSGNQPTGASPTAMASGLLSTDALPDMVTVNTSNDLLTVFQSSPQEPSLLRRSAQLSILPEPLDVAVGDFDQDGDNDIISFSSELGRLDLIRVIPSATLTGQSFKVPGVSIAIAQSDANGDPDLRYDGGGASAETGFCVAMGDVNNDGLSDIAVGSPGEGVVRLYYGGTPPTEIPDLVLTRSAADRFGASVAFGDIDNDGFDDILVGAPQNDDGAVDGGIVFIYRGSDDASPDLGVAGNQAGENFGGRLASGHDLNGDGFDDWAASSPLYDGAGVDAGRVYLFWGNGLDGGSDLRIEGQVGGDFFGAGLGISSDFTGDSQPDLLVGAPGVSSVTVDDIGRIHVYAGGSGIGTIPFMAAEGPGVTAALGFSIAGIGDYNGDGVGDIVAGAPYYDDDGGQDRGRVLIWFGGANADNVPDFQRGGQRTNARLGYAVAAAGDVRNAGTNDVLVSAPGYVKTDGPVDTHQHGRVYILGGASSEGDDPIILATGEVPGAFYGGAVAGGGDANGDGFSDWVIGAPTDNTAGTLAGMAEGLKGGRGGIPGSGAIATGDFNNDGAVDLVATNSANGEVSIFLNDANEVFVDTDRPATEIFVVDGQPTDVTTAKLNGDDFDDLIIIRSDFSDVIVYLGNGDGSFTVDQSWDVGPVVMGFPLDPVRVYAADFTGNGQLDLATVLNAWGAVSIREGDGTLSFSEYRLHVGAALASDIAFGDITGGGNLDVVMTDELNNTVSLLYHRNGGSGKQFATDVPATPARIAPLLAQNFPNPFNPKTLIRYDLPIGGQVSLEVYDVKGRKIATLVDQKQVAGPQQAEWTGRDDSGGEVAAGVYLYRLAVDGELSGQRKMVLVK